ncbi:hypothetical protein OF83DRAFT_311174 [Amylostereum chailletii]|nr:hypothetical protein OF83DRAFT_311174 [Amylostereum chailletii]
MFKNAATKLAHNSTLPVLGGNNDLRPLQDLITAEKGVVNSLVKLSADLIKASEALKAWGLGEGEDLGDTMGASNKLLAYWASTVSRFATHEQSIRDHMKAVRTREEKLDGLKSRRKSVAAKAESADKKLNKMTPENKNYQAQTEILVKLRDEIREMDADILAEEASLGDFKREATRMWMTLKFGGLQELCEKGTIVANFGKLIIAELPFDQTQPGAPRPYYLGHSQTEAYGVDAQMALSEVVFHGEPPDGRPRVHPPTGPPPEGSNVDELGALTSRDMPHSSQTYTSPSSRPMSTGGPGGQYSTMPSHTDHNRLQTMIPVSPADSSFMAEVEQALEHGPGTQPGPNLAQSMPNDTGAQTYRTSQDFGPPAGPPPGAAPPHMPDGAAYGGHDPGYGPSDYDEGLAYMNDSGPTNGANNRMSMMYPPEGNQSTRPSIELNAAAAREVAREMDSLTFSPPQGPPPRTQSPAPISPVDGSSSPTTGSPNTAHPPSPFSRDRYRADTLTRTSNDMPPPPRIPSPPDNRLQTGPPSPLYSALPLPSALVPHPPPNYFPMAPALSNGSSYRTPLETPGGSNYSIHSTSSSTQLNKSSVSPPLPPPGARTISAAAFRRPQNRVASDASSASVPPPPAPLADTSPLAMKKRALPTTPATASTLSTVSVSQFPQPPGSTSPEGLHEDEQFDYLSAYLGHPEEGQGQGHSDSLR